MEQIASAGNWEERLRAMRARVEALGGARRVANDVCQACGGTGWVPGEGETVRRCACWEAKHHDRGRQVAASGVGERFAGFTLESFMARFGTDRSAKRFVNWARTWAEASADKRSDVVMVGPNGTGKTGLAVAMMRAAIERGETAYFTELETLSIRWRATYGTRDDESGETEAEVLDAMTRVGVLVLDEVTGTKATEFIEDKLREIVIVRQRALRPTILTMNVPAALGEDAAALEEAMAIILGPTLFDKLRERTQFFAMFGPSRREAFR